MTSGSFDAFVDAPFRGKSAAEIVDLPVDALHGVSAGDRDHLRDAFGIESVADLATNRFVRRARAIVEEAVAIEHDPGPDTAWSMLFADAPLETYQQHPVDFRLDFGPVYYRGRLDGTARLLIVGQDPAANELVAHRAFIGTSGQRLQGFLRRLGIARDYLMVNTYLYPVRGQFFGTLAELSREPAIMGFRNRMLDHIAEENRIEAVVTVGSAARDAVDRWPGSAGYTRQHLTHPSARDHELLFANWNEGLAALRPVVAPEAGGPEDGATYGSDWVEADLEVIPRRDLPFGMPPWHGVGTHATRAREDDGSTDSKRIIWKAP